MNFCTLPGKRFAKVKPAKAAQVWQGKNCGEVKVGIVTQACGLGSRRSTTYSNDLAPFALLVFNMTGIFGKLECLESLPIQGFRSITVAYIPIMWMNELLE